VVHLHDMRLFILVAALVSGATAGTNLSHRRLFRLGRIFWHLAPGKTAVWEGLPQVPNIADPMIM
jgi:hypothetical protein